MNCIIRDSLFIYFKNNKIALSRCCYTDDYIYLDIDDFFKMSLDDLSKVNFNLNPVSLCTKDYKCDLLPIRNIVVSISTACNLNCEKCIISSHKEEPLTKELYFKVLQHIKTFKLNSLEFTRCGEPFIYFDEIIEFLSSLDNKNIKQVCFTTNGTLLSKSRIDLLHRVQETTGIKYQLSLSIDGINKKHYNKIRHYSFNKVIKILKELVKQDFDVKVQYIYKRVNDVPILDILKFFNKLGISSENINIGVDTLFGSYSKEEELKIISEYRHVQRIFAL